MCGCMKNKFGNPNPVRQLQNQFQSNKPKQQPVPKQGLRKPPPFFNQMVFLHNRNIELLKKNSPLCKEAILKFLIRITRSQLLFCKSAD